MWLEDTYRVLASVDFDKRELNERSTCIRGALHDIGIRISRVLYLTRAGDEAAQESDFAPRNVHSVDCNDHVACRNQTGLRSGLAGLEFLNDNFGSILVKRFVKDDADTSRVLSVRILRVDGHAFVAASRAHSFAHERVIAAIHVVSHDEG
jgi:hypothetical protein